MDELRIWNTARTAAQIQAGMNLQLPGGTAGLVGLYGFDEGTGVLAADGSGQGNIAPVGGATFTERTGTSRRMPPSPKRLQAPPPTPTARPPQASSTPTAWRRSTPSAWGRRAQTSAAA